MLLVEILIVTAALAILAPVVVLFVEVVIALLWKQGDTNFAGLRPRLAVIIPAHNEESGIRSTLDSLIPQLQNDDRILVVADNCTDNTAAVALAAHAEVISRHDPLRRGKGYALDFGVRHLERDPPEVVLIVDADCHVETGSLDRLARLCAQTGRPAQALNLSYAPPKSSVKLRIAEFASVLKNQIRPSGLRKLGLPCQLTGTGMAFPWRCIREVKLATGHVVEDLKLGLELTSSGHPPLFCPEARVLSYFPASEESFRTQRTRWEHGYLGVLVRDAPAVLLRSLTTADGRLLALGLDLCVPPIALLTLLVACVWASAAYLYLHAGAKLPLLLASTSALLLATSVCAAWARHGRRTLSAGTLMLGIVYALWKIPLYARFLALRQLSWVRTKRDQDAA